LPENPVSFKPHQNMVAETTQMRQTKLIVMIALASVLTGCHESVQPSYQVAPQPQAPSLDVGQASLRLAVGQTEAEAITAIGQQPISTEASTCGADTGSPWSCKTLTFGPEHGGPHASQLRVMLNMQVTPARVNNWVLFPAPL
jgi:hypothetical protein